jgi:hypothetical protein
MRFRTLFVLIIIVATALVLATGAGSLEAESPRDTTATVDPSPQTGAWQPGVEFAESLTAMRVAQELDQQRFDSAMHALLDQVVAFVESIPPPFPSEDWFRRISLCESGGTNGWRTGYFGIEAGYPIGHLSYEEQLDWAREIFARAGAGAWGCTRTVGPAY